MKKILIALALFLGTAAAASAQNQNPDVVILKNGSVVTGTIVNEKPNEEITIRALNGAVYTYPMVEVNRIQRQAATTPAGNPAASVPTDYNANESGFWCAVDLMGGYTFRGDAGGAENAVPVEFDAVGGYRFNEYLKVGLGLGARYYINSNHLRYRSMEWAMPLFVNLRGNFIPLQERRVTPFWSMDAGVAFGDGFMARPTIGLRFGDFRRSAFTLALGYQGQQMSTRHLDIADIDGVEVPVPCKKREWVSGIVLKIGYEF